MTETSRKDDVALEHVFYIHYPVQFKKDANETHVQALIDSKNEVNAIHLIFVKELGLTIRPTDVGAQKMNNTTLNTYEIVVAAFSVTDKANRVRFFKKTFLVANVSPKIVFGIPFLTLSSVDVDFLDQKLRWRIYTIEEALPTTKRIELVGKKEFAAAVLNPEHETFVVHVASLNLVLGIHLDREAQIALLLTEKVKILEKYSDFANIFSEKKTLVLSGRTKLNEHAINLEDGKQPSYRQIYSLGPVKLETLKTYIKTHLKIVFIWLSKFLAGAFILFDKKADGSLRLYVDYWGLNNLTIKNRYPLSLIGKSLNRLGWAKKFT